MIPFMEHLQGKVVWYSYAQKFPPQNDVPDLLVNTIWLMPSSPPPKNPTLPVFLGIPLPWAMHASLPICWCKLSTKVWPSCAHFGATEKRAEGLAAPLGVANVIIYQYHASIIVASYIMPFLIPSTTKPSMNIQLMVCPNGFVEWWFHPVHNHWRSDNLFFYKFDQICVPWICC